jgi:hypothetical protein
MLGIGERAVPHVACFKRQRQQPHPLHVFVGRRNVCDRRCVGVAKQAGLPDKKITSSQVLASRCGGDHHFSVTNVSAISRRVGIAHHLNKRVQVKAVQKITFAVDRFVILARSGV